MNEDDRKTFSKAMAHLFSNYGDEVTTDLLDSWWGAFAPYALREIMWAMNRHVTDTAYGHRRPTISDIVRHVTESLPAEKRRRRDAKIREARERIEPLEAELYRLEADVRIGKVQEWEVEGRMNGLRMQIGAMHREAGIDDAPKIEYDPDEQLRALSAHLPRLPRVG
jgi:hypothetical protein